MPYQPYIFPFYSKNLFFKENALFKFNVPIFTLYHEFQCWIFHFDLYSESRYPYIIILIKNVCLDAKYLNWSTDIEIPYCFMQAGYDNSIACFIFTEHLISWITIYGILMEMQMREISEMMLLSVTKNKQKTKKSLWHCDYSAIVKPCLIPPTLYLYKVDWKLYCLRANRFWVQLHPR